MEKREEAHKSNVVIIDPVGKKAGLDSYNDNLAHSISNLGFNVKVLSNYKSQYSQPVFKFRFGRSLLFIPEMIISLLSVFNFLKANKPDVVILHLFKISKASNAISREVKKNSIKLIYILHDLESLIGENLSETEMEAGLHLADEIVVHNQFTYDLLLKKFPTVKMKVSIIPHGNFLDLPSDISKLEARKKLGIDQNSTQVLFFGMIKPSKGIDVLLRAMSHVNANLIVAGRFRMKPTQELNSSMKVLKLAGKLITDLNYISNEKRDLYFKAADIVVLPYRKIFQSGVMIMAMSYGLPVVASDLKPNLEFAEEYDCVEFFNCDNAVDLEEKINFILKNADRGETLQKNALTVLDKKHNWNLIATKFKKIIET